MGSEKWLDAELFDSTKDCFEELRSRGYRIAVASLGHNSVREKYLSAIESVITNNFLF
jgi:phosphoglycolate phosphatase-like HAD superfamily hydrolase